MPEAPICGAFRGSPSTRIATFYETSREMVEMRCLWKQSLELVNDKLVAFLGEEPHSRLETALRDTLRGPSAFA